MIYKHDAIWGIDPGKTGAWAYMETHSGRVVTGIMPVVGGEVTVTPLAKIIREQKNPLVIIEKVHSMPKQGVKAMFSFGCSYGKLIGLCQSMDVAFDFVLPTKWKKDVLEGTKKDKDAAIDYVTRMHKSVALLPSAKHSRPHIGIADAVCLMEWGIRKYGKKEKTSDD